MKPTCDMENCNTEATHEGVYITYSSHRLEYFLLCNDHANEKANRLFKIRELQKL